VIRRAGEAVPCVWADETLPGCHKRNKTERDAATCGARQPVREAEEVRMGGAIPPLCKSSWRDVSLQRQLFSETNCIFPRAVMPTAPAFFPPTGVAQDTAVVQCV
jgi:hypothetical protein